MTRTCAPKSDPPHCFLQPTTDDMSPTIRASSGVQGTLDRGPRRCTSRVNFPDVTEARFPTNTTTRFSPSCWIYPEAGPGHSWRGHSPAFFTHLSYQMVPGKDDKIPETPGLMLSGWWGKTPKKEQAKDSTFASGIHFVYQDLQVPITARVFRGVIPKCYWTPKGTARTLQSWARFQADSKPSSQKQELRCVI